MNTIWSELLIKAAAAQKDGNTQGALAFMQSALRLAERYSAIDDYPLTCTLETLIRLHARLETLNLAQSHIDQLAKITSKKFGMNSLQMVYCLNRQAEVAFDEDNLLKAAHICKQVLHIQKINCGLEHLDTAVTTARLAVVYHTLGRHQEAEPLYKEALKVMIRHVDWTDPQVLGVLHSYAELLKRLHRDSEANHLLKCAELSLARELES